MQSRYKNNKQGVRILKNRFDKKSDKMKTSLYNIGNISTLVALTLAMLLSFGSCDSSVYESEGDCDVTYRLKFRYDLNLKWADAFANEVKSVHLYAFDKDGVLVWQKDELVSPAHAEDYSVLLDLPAGEYRLLAWCGLRNELREESFTVPVAREGETRIEELECQLSRLRDSDGAYSKKRLAPLFYGRLDVLLPSSEDGGEFTYTMLLTKDTNHIRVILQHLSGEDVDVNKFVFRIEDENGLLGYDNEPLADEIINYRPWQVQNSEAGIGKDGQRAIIYVKGAIADFTVNRLMASRHDKMILTITNNEGEQVARIPVIQYALLAKDYYEEEYGRRMTPQELLDREDEYVLTLFLDKNDKWLESSIMIHSWRVVLDDVNIH